MGQRPSSGPRRRIGGLLLATFLALGVSAAPPAVRTALAAGPLAVQANATYTLDPGAARVHVAIDFRATNLKPNSATLIYYYRDITFGVQLEARSVRASDGSGGIGVTTRARQFYTEATVHLRTNLYYRGSTRFTIRYDLVGGAPRSTSPTRVGRAFATFGVWAWGDAGSASTVEVVTPAGFESQVDGDALQAKAGTSGRTLQASPADPEKFYSIVSAENREAYSSTRISLEGGVKIVVLAWPEDKTWTATVSETLQKGLPALRELIGLDWPVAHDLSVRERYTPALEGYAGVFFEEDQRIDVSEDLDPVVIVHEASHAWFNTNLFQERWIYEGLAEEYSSLVLTGAGLDPGDPPTRPSLDDPAHVDLTVWTFPYVIRDQKTDDRERYGYEASFWVMHQIVESAGIDVMRTAFAAADEGRTAYVGSGAPEAHSGLHDYRYLIDLVEPIGKPEPSAVDDAIRDFVLYDTDAPLLAARGPARAAYRGLLEAGDGWLPPWTVRRRLDIWDFPGATKAIEEATAVLALRDQVAAVAGPLGLEPDDALRDAYEHAQSGFAGATSMANAELAALAAVADAKAKIEATPDLMTQVGLIGESPSVPYAAARSAFGAGDLEVATSQAAAASAVINGAAAIGQQRVAIAVGMTLVTLLLLVLLVVLLRRRGRRRRALALAAAVPATDPATDPATAFEPAPTEAYATLAADPAEEPPPPSAGPPDVEGGSEA
jgi:hypothetical protein